MKTLSKSSPMDAQSFSAIQYVCSVQAHMPERRFAIEAIIGFARPLRPASPPPLGVVAFWVHGSLSGGCLALSPCCRVRLLAALPPLLLSTWAALPYSPSARLVQK